MGRKRAKNSKKKKKKLTAEGSEDLTVQIGWSMTDRAAM